MFRARLVFFLALALTTSLMAQSDKKDDLPTVEAETIVVTANRTETPLNEVGNSVSVITPEDMERNGQVLVLDALRDLAGLDVVRTGAPGGLASIFMRGANSEHTLVIVDGVEMQDPIAAGNSFNISHLTADNIDRIEVVRGPQSTLYGSDSLGGVIQIFTKKGQGQPNGSVNIEGGSYGYKRGAASVRGGDERFYYSAGASYQDADGFSAANERLGNLEDDGYTNTTISAQLGFNPAEHWGLSLTARRIDASTDIDNGGGMGQDDPNYVSDSLQTTFALNGHLTLQDGRWRQNFGISHMDQDRDLNNPVDVDHPNASSTGSFEGLKTKLHWVNNFRFNDNHHFTFGAETETEEGSSVFESVSSFGPFRSEFSEQDARTTGLYFQDQWKASDRVNVTMGIRYDDHDRFGNRTTYRTAIAWRVNERGTMIRGSFGTGFKAPSLFQLYSSFGNLDLEPEKSQGGDLGFTQTIASKGIQFGATYFQNDFDTLIDFDNSTFTYNNIESAKTEGLEVFLKFHGHKHWFASLEGTLQNTKDSETNMTLFRRPDEKLQTRLGYRFGDAGQVNLNARYVGRRDFNNFSSDTGRTTLPGYTVLGLAGNVRIFKDLLLTARVENATDKVYEEVLGYGTSESAGYVGIRYAY